MKYENIIRTAVKKLAVSLLVGWLAFVSPAAALALEPVDGGSVPEVTPPPSGETATTEEEPTTGPTGPTGAPEDTGAPEKTGAPVCTGASCTQGYNQGLNQGYDQGLNQGGPTLEELGATADETGALVLPEGVLNTTQGAQQGLINGVSATNSATGAGSTNTAAVNEQNTQSTNVSNTANDTSATAGTANTGANTSNKNTGDANVTTGDASIGVTQVKNDNTTAINGSAGLAINGRVGDVNEDVTLDFADAIGLLTGEGGSRSIQAVNELTGSDSTNDILLSTRTEEITEVQNDGTIDNQVDVAAITGQNQASMNTGSGNITTGDANIAATLLNLLNTTIINGNLLISVEDIFGNLTGDIHIPDLGQLATLLAGPQTLQVDAANEETGSDSTNNVDVNIVREDETTVNNEADINTTVNTNAITGQNEAMENTGGGNITTGDASATAGNISVANTTVEGGNWGLVIVNALNRWVGFLVGDNGDTRQLTQEETLREIEARNSQTGSDSENNIEITDEASSSTTVNNNASITNTINADAITGQNEASQNTGGGTIATGDAAIKATAVNIANTTIKNANLGIAVVNIFGDWVGDLLYGGNSLLGGLFGGGAGAGMQIDVDATNNETGANSKNNINVDVDRHHETDITNDADLATTLNANIDTGNNKANRNTGGAAVETGNGLLGLFSRNIANMTGIAGDGGVALSITGENSETGFNSENRINANINDERIINVNNDAAVVNDFVAVANTGNNEANQNTLGATISTGGVTADVAISNLINQILLNLGQGGGDVTVNAELTNELTGALSVNENSVNVVRDILLTIMNEAAVENLIDLLLNTGGNTANENTGGGNITTGEICVDGELVNVVNEVGGALMGDASITNNADVDNNTNVDADTGNNEANHNTGESGDGESNPCEKVAVVPTPEEPKEEEEEEKEEGGMGGHIEEEQPPAEEGELARKPRIAGIKEAMAAAPVDMVKGLRLGPTGFDGAKPLGTSPWLLFTVGAAVLLTGSYRADRRARLEVAI